MTVPTNGIVPFCFVSLFAAGLALMDKGMGGSLLTVFLGGLLIWLGLDWGLVGYALIDNVIDRTPPPMQCEFGCNITVVERLGTVLMVYGGVSVAIAGLLKISGSIRQYTARNE